jgi:hypothetical protein
MTPSFSSSRAFAQLLAVALCSCAGSSGAKFPAATKLPSDERKPDGVAVDLMSDPPPHEASAATDEAVVTLRTPLGSEAALTSLREFFQAVLREDLFAVSQMLAPGALVSDPRGAAHARFHSLSDAWRQRFAKFDYSLLSGRVVYRDSDVRVYRAGDVGALPYDLRAAMAGEVLQQGDLVLRVPVVNHTIKNERLLGREMTFWLRREDSRFLIYRMAEEVPL